MPLFGYNSYIWDDIALGSRIIQGKFVINFTKANFLYYVLNTLKQASINGGQSKVIAENDNSIEQYDDMNNKTRFAQTKEAQNDPIQLHQKSPLWNCDFDIWVSYGNAKQVVSTDTVGSTIIVLRKVIVTGCSQQLSISGEPIFEEYTFVARDIEFTPQPSSAKTITAKPETVPDSDNIHVKNVGYRVETDGGKKIAYIDITYVTAII
jgi:hypothetical protein